MGKKDRKKKKGQKATASTATRQNAANYSIEQLLDKTDELMDQFEFSMAQKFCERALQMEPDNVRALETSASLLLELGNMDAARQCFGRAIEVQPDEGHEKYMCMGQLLTGSDAVNCFQKGIELMTKRMEQQQQQVAQAAASGDLDEAQVGKRDIAVAYCNMAEIYLTDQCFDEDADAKCKLCLDQGFAADPDYPECCHLLASYWLSKDQPEKAKESMDAGVSLWFPQWKEEVKKTDGEDADAVQVCTIGYPARVNASKILIELKQYELASEILEMLLDEEDEVVETWYLLGWLNYLQGEEYCTNARFYLLKAQKVSVETECEDDDMVKHIVELLEELGPGDEKEEEEGENGENTGEMEVTSDIESDEEENGGDGMEH